MLQGDAHELRPDVLGMLRALTNFSMDSRLVLSLVLGWNLTATSLAIAILLVRQVY